MFGFELIVENRCSAGWILVCSSIITADDMIYSKEYVALIMLEIELT